MCILYFVVSLGKLYKKDTHPPQKKMQICKNKQKQAESTDIPPVLLPLLFHCPIFVFFQPYFGSTGAHRDFIHIIGMTRQKKGAFPEDT